MRKQSLGHQILISGDDRVELLPRRSYEARFRPDIDVIGFAFESQSGSHAFASDRQTPYRTRPNGLAYIPAGCDVMSQSMEGGEYLVLRGPASLGGNRHFSDHIDRRSLTAAFALRRMIVSRQAPDPLALEAAVGILREAVERALTDRLPDANRWMTPRRLKLVDDIIAARLDQPIRISEIASALSLSAGFFTRAFHAATGMPPHRYILERRLSQARLMLEDPGSTLTEIAAACGFASHAHLCACMRRHFCVTPSDFRSRQLDAQDRRLRRLPSHSRATVI